MSSRPPTPTEPRRRQLNRDTTTVFACNTLRPGPLADLGTELQTPALSYFRPRWSGLPVEEASAAPPPASSRLQTEAASVTATPPEHCGYFSDYFRSPSRPTARRSSPNSKPRPHLRQSNPQPRPRPLWCSQRRPLPPAVLTAMKAIVAATDNSAALRPPAWFRTQLLPTQTTPAFPENFAKSARLGPLPRRLGCPGKPLDLCSPTQ